MKFRLTTCLLPDSAPDSAAANSLYSVGGEPYSASLASRANFGSPL